MRATTITKSTITATIRITTIATGINGDDAMTHATNASSDESNVLVLGRKGPTRPSI